MASGGEPSSRTTDDSEKTMDDPKKTTDADPIEVKKVDLHVLLATIKAIAEVV